MARLTVGHVYEFDAVKALCYSGLDSARLREHVGDRLARHLGAASYCFGATDPVTALPVHSISVGLEPGVMEAFFALVLTTPSLDFGRWLARSSRVARLEDLVEDPERDPYTTEILRPSGLGHDVQMACTAGGWSWGHMCLRRGLRDLPFAGHEVRLLDAVAPHLTAGLRAAAQRSALNARPATATGVVVIGVDGRVELANDVAERLFRQPLSGTRHSFLTGVHVVVARLERLLDQDDDAEVLPELTMTEESTGTAYRLRAERALDSDGRARGIVYIEPERSFDAAALARYGLSRRECEVAVGVVRGLTNAELAKTLCMSAHTVQDNVGAVLEKLGPRSRQELAFRLLGGP